MLEIELEPTGERGPMSTGSGRNGLDLKKISIDMWPSWSHGLNSGISLIRHHEKKKK